MPDTTITYGLLKPLGFESADIAVINQNFDSLDEILTPEIVVQAIPAPAPGAFKGALATVLGWVAKQLTNITGKVGWYTAPSVTLQQCWEHLTNQYPDLHPLASFSLNRNGYMSAADKQKLDSASVSAGNNTLIMRDADGRARIGNAVLDGDILNRQTADVRYLRKAVDTQLEARLVAQANLAYSVAQVRNIVFWPSGETPPPSNNGDVIIKTF